MHAQGKGNILEHVQVGKQCTTLEQHAHLFAHVEQLTARQRRQVQPVNPNFTLTRLEFSRDQAQQRGFATARRAHDPRDFATGNLDIDVFENIPLATFEADVLQLNRIRVLGAHLDSLLNACLTDVPPRTKGTTGRRTYRKWPRTIPSRHSSPKTEGVAEDKHRTIPTSNWQRETLGRRTFPVIIGSF